MKVEIWSDVVCPWCYIGKRRFEAALARLARKYGISEEQAAAMHERMTGFAAAEGIEFHLDETQGGNTFDAHRLIQLAKERGLGAQMKERLMLAYFTETEPIGERAVLARLGEELGLA